MLVHLCRLWPASIQHRAVLCGGSSEYNLTSTPRRLTVLPASPALTSIHSTLYGQWIADDSPTPYQCIVLTGKYTDTTESTRFWPDAGLMLARRLWRWLNLNPALVNHGAGMLAAVAHILHPPKLDEILKTNVELMLIERRKQWSNIKLTLICICSNTKAIKPVHSTISSMTPSTHPALGRKVLDIFFPWFSLH